jgi:hypothetical protein
MIAERSASLAERSNFCMSRRIAVDDVAVESAANHLSFMDNNRTDWNFTCRKRSLGATQRLLHPRLI